MKTFERCLMHTNYQFRWWNCDGIKEHHLELLKLNRKLHHGLEEVFDAVLLFFIARQVPIETKSFSYFDQRMQFMTNVRTTYLLHIMHRTEPISNVEQQIIQTFDEFDKSGLFLQRCHWLSMHRINQNRENKTSVHFGVNSMFFSFLP